MPPVFHVTWNPTCPKEKQCGPCVVWSISHHQWRWAESGTSFSRTSFGINYICENWPQASKQDWEVKGGDQLTWAVGGLIYIRVSLGLLGLGSLISVMPGVVSSCFACWVLSTVSIRLAAVQSEYWTRGWFRIALPSYFTSVRPFLMKNHCNPFSTQSNACYWGIFGKRKDYPK